MTSNPLRLLILEDCEDDAVLLTRKIIQAGFAASFERADSVEAMSAALEKGQWDIIISDHSMPQFSAIKAMEMLRDRGIDLPVIIVSGTIDPESAVAAMKAGARDFIMKSDLTRLIPAIERELREARDRQARRKAEEQFRQAQKMESIGRLAGGVAHDFNNLLTAILGYCAFLLRNLDPKDPNHSDVLEIKAAGDRAAVLTRQLLAFSRKQVLQARVLDLNSVISNTEKLLRRVIGEDVELVLSLEKGLDCVKTDSGQFEQILMNLCVNARDAMPQGGTITVRTANVDSEDIRPNEQFDVKPGRYVMISVGDTGAGMDSEVLSHIFEPFFTTKSADKGTGLGLSTVYGIVKQSEGYILVDSEPGRGTSFRIFLPRVGEAPQAREPESAGPKSTGGTEAILLVEDDERVRHLTKRVLAQQGYTVLEAKDGEEALALCARGPGPIRLMVTDVVMPQMSGGDLVRRIESRHPGLKVLYMSGYTENVVAVSGILKDGINFLEKPFTQEALIRKVREILDSSE